jgi:hypothetical protein
VSRFGFAFFRFGWSWGAASGPKLMDLCILSCLKPRPPARSSPSLFELPASAYQRKVITDPEAPGFDLEALLKSWEK